MALPTDVGKCLNLRKRLPTLSQLFSHKARRTMPQAPEA